MAAKFDLHLHTSASDGRRSPEEVVREAAGLGLWCIAITDHDTTDGVDRALQEGHRAGLSVIAGAEFTAEYDGELHILGYGINRDSAAYQDFILDQQVRRAERNELMLQILADMGMKLPDQFLPESVGGVYGRLHMARGLVAAGYVPSVQQAFDRFLRTGAPAYVRRHKYGSAELIRAIAQSGGEAVLAHPGRMELDRADMRKLVHHLYEQGLKGIEAYYPTHTADEVEYYQQLAQESALVCTFGSDCHGAAQTGIAEGFDRFPIGQQTTDWLNALLHRGCGT